ncbi:hypothetical protein JOY44_02075 [Phormidium sp. CLA17]|uniref:VMAP-C domain-containing protein n=1 Tax=Leptolyngbya sp. Cla-17 TaxID=2803751 RepID=UPI001490B1CB|nr:hypothetical protein [Leptolyngbya sp. Cla-17]MBM0740413.1 hypothetical protein [Leptolyngbya sp. Cla-17]
MMNGESIDARESQGLVNQPQAEVNQHFGEKKEVDTGGGDSAGGDLDKSTQTINNFFLFGGKAVGAESQQSLQGLSQLLGQLDDSELIQRAYRDALPADASLSRSEVASYGDIVAQLQEFRRLPEFIQRLVQDEQVPQAIHDQLKDATQQFSQTEGWQQSMGSSAATVWTLQSYLQIVLRPDLSTNGFVINGWLIADDHVLDPAKRFQPLDVEEQRKGASCQFEEIPTVLDQFLNLSLQHLTGKRYDLTIEIFLPLDYLCEGVDGWKLTDSFFEDECYEMGTKYRVLVRSRERLEPKYLASRLNQWYANWERVKAYWHTVPNDCDFEHLSNFEGCNWKRVVNNLTQKLGLKLTCGLIETHNKELFTALLKAAAPIALWARCHCDHWDQVAEMDALLLAGPLLALSEIVWKKRQDAYLADKPEDQLGAYLALLWEDPYRLTPDALAQLVPPGQ